MRGAGRKVQGAGCQALGAMTSPWLAAQPQPWGEIHDPVLGDQTGGTRLEAMEAEGKGSIRGLVLLPMVLPCCKGSCSGRGAPASPPHGLHTHERLRAMHAPSLAGFILCLDLVDRIVQNEMQSA